MDKHFKVRTVARTEITPETLEVLCLDEGGAQTLSWLAAHRDYSENNSVLDNPPPYLPKKDAEAGDKLLGMILNKGHYGVCYSADTKVLTDRGFIPWPEVTEEDRLAAFNYKVGEFQKITFEKPKKLVKLPFRGDLYYASSRDYDQMVTEDHNLVVSHRKPNQGFSNFYRKQAKDLKGSPYRVIKSGYLSNKDRTFIPSDYPGSTNTEKWTVFNFLSLVGFFISDGCKPESGHNYLRFRLKKKRKIDYLKSLVPVEELANNIFVFREEGIGKYFLSNFFDSEGNKILPSEYLGLDTLCLFYLLDGFKNGDGTNWKNTDNELPLFDYDSTSLSLIEMLQALVHLNGLSANITFNGKTKSENHKQCYRLSITEKVYSRFEKRNPLCIENSVPYDGFVYCAEVSTGALIVQRNGKVVVSGNCEHAHITFECSGFPHSVPMQARTHRVPFCLSGDTEIYFERKSSTKKGIRKVKLSKLAETWIGGRPHQEESPVYSQARIKNSEILVYNTETQCIDSSHITNIWESGEKEVFQVTTESGRTIKASKDHKFLVADINTSTESWKRLKDIQEGDYLLALGRGCPNVITPTEIDFTLQELASEVWKPLADYPSGVYEISNLGRVRSYYSRNGKGPFMSKPAHLKTLSKAKKYLFFSTDDGKRRNVHVEVLKAFLPLSKTYEHFNPCALHRNDNSFDNRLENLYWGTNLQNKQDQKVNSGFQERVVLVDKILKIQLAGIEKTYDLEVEHSSHNFFGNGLVTHNSFDVQSQRYTGKRITNLVNQFDKLPSEAIKEFTTFHEPLKLQETIQFYEELQEIFYVRPEGEYLDRQGKKFSIDEYHRRWAYSDMLDTALCYEERMGFGWSEECARDILSQGVRQSFFMTTNIRGLMHFLDMRSKADAQIEIQWLCDLLFEEFKKWVPETAAWYEKRRLHKNKLSP